MLKIYKKLGYNIKLILITTFLSNIGIFMVIPFLAIYLNELNTINMIDVGIIIGVAFWCQKAGSLLGGISSDFFSIKGTLLLGLIIRIPGYLLLGFTSDFYILLVSCSLIGLGSSIYLPAAKSYLVQATEDSQRVDALSLRVVFANLGVALGPIIGLVVFSVSASLLFSSVGIIFILLFLLNNRLNSSDVPLEKERLKIHDFISLSLSYKMIAAAIANFIFMSLYMQIEVTIPLLAKETYDKSIVSLVFIINAIIVVLFQIHLSKWSCSLKNNHPNLVGFLLFSIAFYLLDHAEYSYWIIFLSVAIFSFSQIIFQIRLDFEATLVNPKMVASSFGIMSLAAAFGGLFGSYFGTTFYSSNIHNLSLWELLALVALVMMGFSFINNIMKYKTHYKNSQNNI